jgi:hypothetical protein
MAANLDSHFQQITNLLPTQHMRSMPVRLLINEPGRNEQRPGNPVLVEYRRRRCQYAAPPIIKCDSKVKRPSFAARYLCGRHKAVSPLQGEFDLSTKTPRRRIIQTKLRLSDSVIAQQPPTRFPPSRSKHGKRHTLVVQTGGRDPLSEL